jgi:hypothetical protein
MENNSMKKIKILISIPSLWSIRNFIYSDFIKQVCHIYEIEFLVPENSNYIDIITKSGLPAHIYPVKNSSFLEKVIYKSLNRILINKNIELQKSKLVQLSISKPVTFHQFVLHYVSLVLSTFFHEKCLMHLYHWLVFDKMYDDTRKLLEKENNTVFLATNFVVKHELNLFINLRNLKNRKINFVNSFDNISSRGFIPYKIFDNHIVWNQKMKDELINIFKIKETKVDIIGTPQFDFLFQNGNKSLDVNDRVFEVVEKGRYILYCSGHSGLLPFEKEIVEKIKSYINLNYPDIYIIVRLHPLDYQEKWLNHFKNDRILFDMPWKQNEVNPLLSIPKKSEFTRHARLLKNALLILNIGSTTSLDACVLDKPIYNIYFKEFNKQGALDLIYNSEHFKPIIESGAAPLINNLKSLDTIIKNALNNNVDKDLSRNRKYLANTYCGFKFDNSFTDRFKEYLNGFRKPNEV